MMKKYYVSGGIFE